MICSPKVIAVQIDIGDFLLPQAQPYPNISQNKDNLVL